MNRDRPATFCFKFYIIINIIMPARGNAVSFIFPRSCVPALYNYKVGIHILNSQRYFLSIRQENGFENFYIINLFVTYEIVFIFASPTL